MGTPNLPMVGRSQKETLRRIRVSLLISGLTSMGTLSYGLWAKNIPMLILTAALFVHLACFVYARKASLREDQERAAWGIATAIWVLLPPGVLLVPSNYPVYVLLVLLPFGLVLPHMRPEHLHRLFWVTLGLEGSLSLLWWCHRRGLLLDSSLIPVHVADLFGVLFVPIIASFVYQLFKEYMLRVHNSLSAVSQSNKDLQDTLQQLQKAQESTENAFTFLRTVIDSLHDGMLVTDAQGRILHVNPAIQRLLDVDAESLRGASFRELHHHLADLIEKSLQAPEELWKTEFRLAHQRIGLASTTGIVRDPNLVEFTFPLLSSPDLSAELHGEEGLEAPRSSPYAPNSPLPLPVERLGVVTLVRDITREKEVDQMKTEFISTVSHELRTPLTSVLGFAKLIQKRLDDVIFPQLPSEERKLQRAANQIRSNVEIIVAEGTRLTSLINDVLDIAKMESGKIEWNMQPLRVQDVLERACARMENQFQQKSLKLHKQIQEDLPEVMGDADRLLQVMLNLLSNAVKFTEQGSITCKVRQIDHEVLVSIQDTGVGIAKEDQTAIFEKFRQAGDTLTEKPKGTGLGLPICREIIDHHGGRIWVESKDNKGSTFSFTLLTNTERQHEWPTYSVEDLINQFKSYLSLQRPPHPQREDSILVVDDEASIRELLFQELKTARFRVLEAADGAEALEKTKHYQPDLILLDMLMPKLGGLDVMLALRQNPDTIGIPVAILSIVDDQEQGYGLGICRYLQKPIVTDHLVENLYQILQEQEDPRVVYLFEQDKDAMTDLCELLQGAGYSVMRFDDLAQLLRTSKQSPPHFMLVNRDLCEPSALLRQCKQHRIQGRFLVQFFRTSPQQDTPPAEAPSTDASPQA
ncbi:MAG: response regulator [Myxococcales bacterium]|nr:response regulator [Myxococcales bacterium]